MLLLVTAVLLLCCFFLLLPLLLYLVLLHTCLSHMVWSSGQPWMKTSTGPLAFPFTKVFKAGPADDVPTPSTPTRSTPVLALAMLLLVMMVGPFLAVLLLLQPPPPNVRKTCTVLVRQPNRAPTRTAVDARCSGGRIQVVCKMLTMFVFVCSCCATCVCPECKERIPFAPSCKQNQKPKKAFFAPFFSPKKHKKKNETLKFYNLEISKFHIKKTNNIRTSTCCEGSHLIG